MSTTAPDWLLEAEVGLCPCGCVGKRRKGSFVDRTIGGAAALMRQAMSSEDTVARGGLLQRVDARAKLIGVAALLVTAAFVRHLPILAAFYLIALVLAMLSNLSLRFFVKRVWLFIPVFTGIVVLPATFSFVTHGHIVVPFGTWFGHRVGITAQGLTSAGLIVMRVAVSISLVVLLTLTTPWNRLLAALRALAVPRLFVMVLAMAYRYVFHLLDVVTDMYTARKARTVGAADVASGRRFVAATAGALFGKSHALSEEVYMAMVARGYTGHVRTSTPTRIGGRDIAWIGLTVAITLLVLWSDHAIGN